MICHYWFFNHEFKFQDSLCNGYHDLTRLCLNISNIAIITVKNIDYHCIIHKISKSEAINLLKNSCLQYCLQFQCTECSVFLLYCFCIYRMVDNEYSMDIYKSVKISIGTVIRNPEMLKFVPDHLKAKKINKHAVKKLPFLIRSDPDQCKTHQMCDKAILENGGTLKPVPDCYKNQEMCNKAVNNYPHALEFVPGCYMTQKLCNKAVDTHPSTIEYAPDQFKTQEM